MSGWRCFVAVPIDDSLRAALSSAVDGWRQTPEGERLRWTEPAGWHVTLAFLGSTDPARVSAIASVVSRLRSGAEPFTLQTGGLGAFPSPNAARVVWYGIDDGEHRLAAIAAGVRGALGVEEAAPFRAHLSLARVRGQGRERLGEWLDTAAADAPRRELRVDRLDLMRSHLGRGPARYEVLASVELGVQATRV